MINITDEALMALHKSLQATGENPDAALRLIEVSGSFCLQLDAPGEDDRIIEHEGRRVLVIGKSIDDRFPDALIDVHEGVEGRLLVISRQESE
ncbi:MAG: hypothetical protein ACE5JL_02685 [Dehalococcoidia bacterium]